ncbi:FecR family protein [Parasphingorhabdus cellanae]|uniref:FecR domain-containing protein n=1 Tax=Parasphingorhabdus cellanae TaxID=2806553 RepID=A0ABX7T3U6_9SPHN|nr:FecR domain-containing protein [Parasphingorhabdus cellanae]QTD55217.1 FecR domain-containing protein [Parasphingorhabdus cellanae]
MAEKDNDIRDQAVAWVIRTQAADFAKWEEFTLWLEADHRHNLAYEKVLSAVDNLSDLTVSITQAKSEKTVFPKPANDEYITPERLPNRRRVMFGAIAASLVVAVSAGVWTQMPQPYDVMTGPGEREIVALPDGSKITLNGNTKIALDHKRPRYARLVGGEALFTVVHQQNDPFVVDTADVRLVDAGTEFNVIRTADALDVTVSEGLVIYNPDRENVSLPAGKRLYRPAAKNRVTVSTIAIEQVGSWRTGRLSFAGETLGEVAAALDRNLPVSIAVSPDIAGRPFSGVIQLDGDGQQNIEPIAAVLGVQAKKTGKGWILIGDDAVP